MADGLDAAWEVEAAEAEETTPADDEAVALDSAGVFKELTEEDNMTELAVVSKEDVLVEGDVLWAGVDVACGEGEGDDELGVGAADVAAEVTAIKMLQLDR